MPHSFQLWRQLFPSVSSPGTESVTMETTVTASGTSNALAVVAPSVAEVTTPMASVTMAMSFLSMKLAFRGGFTPSPDVGPEASILYPTRSHTARTWQSFARMRYAESSVLMPPVLQE